MASLPKIALRPTPHRHTFYEVFLVMEGSGSHYVDFVRYEVQPHSIHFIGPGQIHYWDIDGPAIGFAFLFESALFLEAIDQQLLQQLNFFHIFNSVSVLNLTPQDGNHFQNLAERIEFEYQQSHFARQFAITSWLRLFLIEAQRLVMQDETRFGNVSTESQLASRYTELVEQHGLAQHKVEWYANQLSVTAAHLSKSVKSALGLTAGKLLRKRIVLEAKRLLVHTDETAATIALQLNFEDASYFGRFFKRETDQTPKQFRSSFPKKYQNLPT